MNREELKDNISGHLIVIGYERMAIGGGEGYISMFKKEKVHAESDHS